MGIQVGDAIPNVSLQSQTGETVDLKSFNGNKCVVLYFYPKDDTPGCTKESCSFRDSYTAFQDAGAEVIGISADDVASHKTFATKYNLPFTLLIAIETFQIHRFARLRLKRDVRNCIPNLNTHRSFNLY